MKTAAILMTAALALLATSAIAEDVRKVETGDEVQMGGGARTEGYAAPQDKPASTGKVEYEWKVEEGES